METTTNTVTPSVTHISNYEFFNQFDGVAEIYPKDGGHNNVFYPVRGFRTASRSFVDSGVGPSKKAILDDKEIIGTVNKSNISLPIKEISDFSNKQQVKMLRQQTIIQTLINSLDSK